MGDIQIKTFFRPFQALTAKEPILQLIEFYLTNEMHLYEQSGHARMPFWNELVPLYPINYRA
jgi:hypothetical protein